MAFLIGHLMQYGAGFGALMPRAAEARPAPELSMPRDPGNPESRLPAGGHFASLAADGAGVSTLRAGPPDLVIRHPAPSDPFAGRALLRSARFSPYGLSCDVSLDLVPVPGGMLSVRVAAPCHPNARLEILHEGLRVALRTSDLGLAEVALPVLAEDARVEVRLPDGQTAVSTARVRDASRYERVALGWSGEAMMSIHAFEFGATYGAPGHVHRGGPATRDDDGPHGSVILVGDPDVADPLVAEVYTFPTGVGSEGGAIRLHVEAEVTPATCGQEITGEALQKTPFGPPSVTRLRLEMPGCEAVGDILVLKNILRDLRIASN